MSLRQRPLNHERTTEPGAVVMGGDSSVPPATDANVLVSYGTHHTQFPIRGLSVRQARESLSRLMNIDESAVAVINGAPVEEEDTMIDQQVSLISFVKPASIRGCFQ